MTATVVEELDAQHRRVAELFEKVSSPDEDRPAVLHKLLRELAAHVAAERSAVEPVVRKEDLGEDGLSAALKDDYKQMEELMVLIERRKFNSPDIPDLVTQLKAVSAEHTARSERELFPALRAGLDQQAQEDLARDVDNSSEMVTTHPHPHLLSMGPVIDKVTGLASRWDKLRDRTVNNRHPGQGPGDHPGDSSMGGAT